MRRRARLVVILAILAVAGAVAAVLTTRTASAFPPGTCDGTSCTGSKTDAFTGVPVCEPGTTVYWEDSNLPADVTNVRLAKFSVTPNPPCTGATVGAPTSDPWPASPKDPDGTTPAGEPGKKIFRFRWTVTVPTGSKSNGTMSVAWTLDWTRASVGVAPCRTTGYVPAHCRYDLEASIAAPDTFTAERVQLVKLKISVYNNGPAASTPLAYTDGELMIQAHIAHPSNDITIELTGPDRCHVSGTFVACPVRGLRPHGEETFVIGLRWTADDRQYFNELRKRKNAFLKVTARIKNPQCDHEERTCTNNNAVESIAAR